MVLHVLQGELEAVPSMDARAPPAALALARGAARGRQHRALSRRGQRVERLVIPGGVMDGGQGRGVLPPHLPRLVHLLRHEAAAVELGLGAVPRPGHRVPRAARHVVPQVGHHLRLHRPLHLQGGISDRWREAASYLLSEDVCQGATHHQDHKKEQH